MRETQSEYLGIALGARP